MVEVNLADLELDLWVEAEGTPEVVLELDLDMELDPEVELGPDVDLVSDH